MVFSSCVGYIGQFTCTLIITTQEGKNSGNMCKNKYHSYEYFVF